MCDNLKVDDSDACPSLIAPPRRIERGSIRRECVLALMVVTVYVVGYAVYIFVELFR